MPLEIPWKEGMTPNGYYLPLLDEEELQRRHRAALLAAEADAAARAREEALEEAARVADADEGVWSLSARRIAAAIRGLKSQPPKE